MTFDAQAYKEKKVIPIGTVRDLTGLTERQIRYYEQRKLIFPERSEKGTRKYSFLDIEELVRISQKVEKGTSTYELRQEMVKKERASVADERKKMIQGQLSAHFGMSYQKK